MRSQDWPEKLNEYILSQQGKEFALGHFDCCSFSFGAAQAMTGDNLLPEYSGAKQALKMLKEKPLIERLREIFPEVHPAKAQRGDIGYFEDACGVVIGRNVVFVGDPWRLVPVLKMEAVFRV